MGLFRGAIKLPGARSAGQGDGLRDLLNVLAAGDFFRAHAQNMGRGLLAVDDAEVPGLQLANERHEGDL